MRPALISRLHYTRGIMIPMSSKESRNGCSRCALLDANTMCRSMSSAPPLRAMQRSFASLMQALNGLLRWRARPGRRTSAIARRQARCRSSESARRENWARAENLPAPVTLELKPLRLERARFSLEVVSDLEGAGLHGIDRIEFWVKTNPGSRPGPLMKVASGGELARFLLALKVVLADRGSAPTLVFDEIDTGAGGAVADAIGVRLARLAGQAQVIAVTHAPQVAARADRHYLISKSAVEKGKRVATRVSELIAEGRREEIARMLAGAEITAEARAAAERLIQAAS